MSRETYAFALKNALTEIRNVCPDVQASFLFDKEATIIAGDTETSDIPSKKLPGLFRECWRKLKLSVA